MCAFICFCVSLSSFNAVTPLLAPVSRISLHDFFKLEFFRVLQGIAKLRKFGNHKITSAKKNNNNNNFSD